MVRTARKEAKKQLLDQFLHALWGFATGLLPPVLYFTLGPWGLVGGGTASVASCVGWFFREREQASDGSHLLWEGAPEWLDPALDSTVFVVAVVLGAWLGIDGAWFGWLYAAST